MSKKFKDIRILIYAASSLSLIFLLLSMFNLIKAVGAYSSRSCIAAISWLFAAILLLTALLVFLLPAHNRMSCVLETLIGSNEGILKSLFSSSSYCKPETVAELIRSDILAEENLNFQAEIEKKQIVLSTLQKQINPHFLYNTLDCLRGEALIRGQDEIADIISVLSSFFRYSISNKGSIVTVYEEIQNVKNYYKIQCFRFSDLAPLEIECIGDQSCIYDTLIPKLSLQPLVENSISHGLSSRTSTGRISLSFTVQEQDLVISCRDNGIGIEPAALKNLNDFINTSPDDIPDKPLSKGTGIGLRNVNRRISLLFGKPYGITVYSVPGEGTAVNIRIPIGINPTGGAANG